MKKKMKLIISVDDGGILSITNPSKYQLPSSYKDRNNSNAEVYSMSMFHQLHCLVSNARGLGGTFADSARTPFGCSWECWKASSMIHLQVCTGETFLRQSLT